MGLYTYIGDNEIKNWRKVKDAEVNELLQEALGFDKTLMISSYNYTEKKWFKKNIQKTIYSVYHEQISKTGGSFYEAREQLSASGEKRVVLAYLYGIINGFNLNKKEFIKTENPSVFTEKELIELGLKKNTETKESSGSDYDFTYYTLGSSNSSCFLITSCFDEKNDTATVEVFNDSDGKAISKNFIIACIKEFN